MEIIAKDGNLYQESWLRIELGKRDNWVIFTNKDGGQGVELTVEAFLYLLGQYHQLVEKYIFGKGVETNHD